MMERSTGYIFFGQSRTGHVSHHQRPDSVLRGLRRRERMLQDDIQQLLDSQAAGLAFGRQLDENHRGSDAGTYSDIGSNRPTETFGSTARSRSTIHRNLYSPSCPTSDGNVIPSRQLAKTYLPGLRTARNGLRAAMESLKELRQEEREYIAAAAAERKSALRQLDQLDDRRLEILSELAGFDGDGEEPLARELRELDERCNLVDQEIDRLEKQLTELRKNRLWLRDKMRGVQGKREAALSGYRGALTEVDSKLSMLMRRPPIEPLDPAIVGEEGKEPLLIDLASAGGPEFLSLDLARRSPALAKTWWQAELAVLERRGMQLENDQQALHEGSMLWRDVLSLVFNFESDIRQILRGSLPSGVDSSTKGKSREECLRVQVANMDNVVTELKQAMDVAESKGWNLLICAIGAELEAFKEALGILSTILPPRNDISSALGSPASGTPGISRPSSFHQDDIHVYGSGIVHAAQDLVPSFADESNPQSTASAAMAAKTSLYKDSGDDNPESQSSENEVPLEFLAEHE